MAKTKMTEADWLAARSLMDFGRPVDTPAARRKTRLLGCACVRRALVFLPGPVFADCLGAAERFADGELTWDEMKGVRKQLSAATRALHPEWTDDYVAGGGVPSNTALAQKEVADALEWATRNASHAVVNTTNTAAYAFANAARPDWDCGRLAEELEQVKLAHCIFGNPFRPATFAPDWRTSNAVGVAQAMYAARDFADAPILADTLEDAGCDAAELLAHLRGPGEHVRGCWAVDLVLGKA